MAVAVWLRAAGQNRGPLESPRGRVALRTSERELARGGRKKGPLYVGLVPDVLLQGVGFGTGGFLGFFCSLRCLSRFPIGGLLVVEQSLV